MYSPRTLTRKLPRGLAAVYFGGSTDAIVINRTLTPALRRAARQILLAKPQSAFVAIKLADLS